MRLLNALILRLMAVVLFCLSLTAIWILVSTHSSIDAAASQSAQRVENQLRGIYWQLMVAGGVGSGGDPSAGGVLSAFTIGGQSSSINLISLPPPLLPPKD